MKFRTLINLIKLESKKAILYGDIDRKIQLDMVYTIIKRSRTQNKFIENFVNHKCKNKEVLNELLFELLDKRLQELQQRVGYEKMFFEGTSDTIYVLENLDKQILFYTDIKDKLKEGI